MKYGINKVVVAGHLGATPELRYTANNNPVCNMRLAITESAPKAGGGFEDRTTWVNVTVWGKPGEACGKNLDKGSPVLVEGRLSVRSYEKDGQKHYSTDIVADKVVFLGERRGGQNDENQDAEPPREQRREEPRGGYARRDDRRASPRGAPPQGRSAPPQGGGPAYDY